MGNHHIIFRSVLLTLFVSFMFGCSSDVDVEEEPSELSFFDEYDTRNFKMGFTTWPYAPSEEAVRSTDTFLETNGDIYSEHIDSEIPWSAWMKETSLPEAFTNMVAGRKARRSAENSMTLSISLLNIDRSDLMPDFDAGIPAYSSLDDTHIADAYYKHVSYLMTELAPNYLVISVEADGLLKHAPEKWEEYKSLMLNVKSRIKNDYPSIPISESMMLHNFYQPDFGNSQEIIAEVGSYLNTMDFAAISFYPFLKGQSMTSEFQAALDFLHANVNIPIAFAETGHLSENLTIEGLDLFIPGNQTEQDAYMQTLLINAQQRNYEYIIWWTHRDYDPLWETFPEALKDLGKVWISTGIINEDGAEKEAYSSWERAFNK